MKGAQGIIETHLAVNNHWLSPVLAKLMRLTLSFCGKHKAWTRDEFPFACCSVGNEPVGNEPFEIPLKATEGGLSLGSFQLIPLKELPAQFVWSDRWCRASGGWPRAVASCRAEVRVLRFFW